MDAPGWPALLHARVASTPGGTYRDLKTGDLTNLDYWVLSGCLASVIAPPTRVPDFPPRNQFAVEASLGPGARAQQVAVLEGPQPLPCLPTAGVREDVEDEDGEIQCVVGRGGPGRSWADLMRHDSELRY
eukprot:1100149-Pyramimonas_sp.AAC.1